MIPKGHGDEPMNQAMNRGGPLESENKIEIKCHI